MRQDFVPEVKGKFRVGGAQTWDEVVFEGLDRAFGGILLVEAGWS